MIFIAIPFLTYNGPPETDGSSKIQTDISILIFLLLDPIGDPLGISSRTEDFTVSKNLLSSGADALERIISSYKEVRSINMKIGFFSFDEKIFI
jgi:hypothetical protein